MSKRHTVEQDFNGDGTPDLVWSAPIYNTSVIWLMDSSGRMILGGSQLSTPPLGASNLLAGDVNADGTADLIWQTIDGRVTTWPMSSGRQVDTVELSLYGQLPPVVAMGDFNGDGKDDLLWRQPPTSEPGMGDGLWVTAAAEAAKVPRPGLGSLEQIPVDFRFEGVGDFNGDGKDDLLFRGWGNATVGSILIENLNTAPVQSTDVMQSERAMLMDPGAAWSISTLGDFNGDGKTDIVWQHTDGTPVIWLMDNNRILAGVGLPDVSPEWTLIDAQDFNGGGKDDLLWRRDADGVVVEWTMDGTRLVEGHVVAVIPPGEWFVRAL